MYSSYTAVIQKIALYRVGRISPGVLRSLSASLKEEQLLVRMVVQTGLPALHLEQIKSVISETLDDLRFVFGRRWSVRSEMIEASPSNADEPLEIVIFDCRKQHPPG